MTSFATIGLSEIRESTTNPRKTFDEASMRDLVESVREHGVLQPILLRRRGPAYEIVAGARRFRAATAAGLSSIPAVVRELDDKQALEVQVIENLQRSDLAPLEEARGYRTLLDQHGYEVAQLAAALGKSTSYVYTRLRLLDLPTEVLEMVDDGHLPVSHALLLGRIQDPERQIEAAQRIGADGDETFSSGAMSVAAARRIIEREFLLQLAEAPFDLDDATLCPAAGACTNCPKRTRNQATLFDTPTEHDLCTDGRCFEKKVEATWDRRREQAITEGIKVEEAPSFQMLDQLVDPDDQCFESNVDDGDGEHSYRELVGDEIDRMPKVLVREGRGEAGTFMVRRSDVMEALQKGGQLENAAKPVAKAAAKRDDLKRTKDHERRLAVAAAVVDSVRSGSVPLQADELLDMVLRFTPWPKPARAEVGKLFQLDLAEKWVNDQPAFASETDQWIEKASATQRKALIVTLLAWGVSGPSDQWDGSYTDSFLRVAEALDIDVNAIDSAIAEEKPAKKGKAKKAGKAKAGAS